jgi:hypothetical protein
METGYEDVTGSKSHPLPGFGIGKVESSGSITKELGS